MAERDSLILRAGESCARFSALGAECQEWRIGSRDMLWPGDARVWPANAPVLFPTCGWSRDGKIRIGGNVHPMPVHGFAAQALFTAEQLGADAIRFTLEASDETRRFYPYAFQLSLTYRLAVDALSVEITVANRGDVSMPYSCGLHPGFTWKHEAGPHAFFFDEAERAEVPVIAPGGLFSDLRRPVPLHGRKLDLTPALFAAEALCFVEARSRGFEFAGPEGVLRIEAPDFPHLVLWNSAAAPFLAIESWAGTGEPEHFEGDFASRPSMLQLAPGKERTHAVSYRWQALGTGGASP